MLCVCYDRYLSEFLDFQGIRFYSLPLRQYREQYQ